MKKQLIKLKNILILIKPLFYKVLYADKYE